MNADGDEQVNLTPKDQGDLPTAWCSFAPSWSANDREIFVTSFRPSTAGHSEVFVMNLDGTDTRQLTNEAQVAAQERGSAKHLSRGR